MPADRVLDFHVRLVPRPGARERLLAVMDDCGLERAVVCAGGTIDLDQLSRHLILGGHVETDADNDAVLGACEGTDGRLVPFFFANPYREAQAYQASTASGQLSAWISSLSPTPMPRAARPAATRATSSANSR